MISYGLKRISIGSNAIRPTILGRLCPLLTRSIATAATDAAANDKEKPSKDTKTKNSKPALTAAKTAGEGVATASTPSIAPVEPPFPLPRGVFDILPNESKKRRKVIETAENVVSNYGFQEIQTPIFEISDVFTRALGNETDVVKKEMYLFPDRLNKTLFALRPENTAPIMRSAIQRVDPPTAATNLQVLDPPLNYFYHGPMFRYERPQKGRFRQFHQFGVESIGVDGPYEDAQIISMAYDVLNKLGIKSGVEIQINSLGDEQSIKEYEIELEKYFIGLDPKTYSEDTATKIKSKRYLRILDSKAHEDKVAIEGAPSIMNSLNPISKKRFNKLCSILGQLNIPYKINTRLVRGLDYYSHTIFEIVSLATLKNDQSKDIIGTGLTILAGGRYDKLSTTMGRKKPIGAIGWAFGMERILLEMEQRGLFDTPKLSGILIVPIFQKGEQLSTPTISDNIIMSSFKMAKQLRDAGIRAELWHNEIGIVGNRILNDEQTTGTRGNSSSIKKGLEIANKLACKGAIFIGKSELEAGICSVRNIESKRLEQVKFEDVVKVCVDLDANKW